MISLVKDAIKRYNMFDGARHVTVALSGGADSVSLLLVLLELRDEFGYEINAAHLNHSLRGTESDGDEAFVRSLCDELGVELFCERADVNKISEESGESIELAARRVRYEFLNRVAGGLIATAHTADDNIETVLHNMVRGTGLKGLTGIPPVRDNIVRPLILTRRSEIEAYLAKKNVSFRTDSTNSDDTYTRNKIRHGVLPVLKSVNGNAVGNVSRLTELLRADADFIDIATRQAFGECAENSGLNTEKLLRLHIAVRSRVISRLYELQVGTAPEEIHIQSVNTMLEAGGNRRSVQKNMYAVIKDGILFFETLQKKADRFYFDTENSFPCEIGGMRIYTESGENFKKLCRINSLLLKCAVDCDKICGKLIIRSRESGDRISLQGRNVTKTLKKLFNESKTDLQYRDAVPVAADDGGVLWVCGFGADERAAVKDTTKTVLLFDISGLTGAKGK